MQTSLKIFPSNWTQQPKIGYLPQGLTQLKVKDFPLTVQDFFALKTTFFTQPQVLQ